MANEDFERPETVEAGPPASEREGVSRESARPPSQEELDERQRKAGTTRRPMGPTVEDESRDEEAPEEERSPPDVPPTTPEGV
jgi:hypothetical protein